MTWVAHQVLPVAGPAKLPRALAAFGLLAAVALAGGVALRLWRVASDGEIDGDSAGYIAFGNYYKDVLFHHFPHYLAFDTQSKPAFLFLATLSAIVFGFEVYALPALNALLACGIGLMAYQIARLYSDSLVAPLAALALVMFTPFLIDLDRHGLAHTGATLTLLTSIYALMRWSERRWAARRFYLIASGVLLGVAFLFHASVLLYVISLGAIVAVLGVTITTPNLKDKLVPLVVFGASSAVPIIVVECLYRSIFFFWPELVGPRSPALNSFFGFGYVGDVLNQFDYIRIYKANAKAQGFFNIDTAQDPMFLFNVLRLFRFDAVGVIFGCGILFATIGLGVTAMRRRSWPSDYSGVGIGAVGQIRGSSLSPLASDRDGFAACDRRSWRCGGSDFVYRTLQGRPFIAWICHGGLELSESAISEPQGQRDRRGLPLSECVRRSVVVLSEEAF